MKTVNTVLVIVISLVVVGAAGFFLIGYFKPKPAGISVITNVPASVYINGSLSGKSPYKSTLEPGQISLKLVPEDESKNLFPYETKITLTSGIETVVRREFGETDETSSGDILSFEKRGGGETSLIVISSPDNAQVSIDGVPRGFAPYKSSSISPAKHQISVKAPNFNDRTMTAQTLSGYQLTVYVKLASGTNGGAASSPSPSPVAEVKKYVEIGQTPTGFLRVRTQPGTKGEEIAEVKPGEKYPYLETDSATGWYKIQYQEPKPGLPSGITGWISNEFSQITDTPE